MTKSVGEKMPKKYLILIIILLVILLFPIKTRLKDGGTVEYKALTYKISKVHRLISLESNSTYTTGLIIEIFGKKYMKN